MSEFHDNHHVSRPAHEGHDAGGSRDHHSSRESNARETINRESNKESNRESNNAQQRNPEGQKAQPRDLFSMTQGGDRSLGGGGRGRGEVLNHNDLIPMPESNKVANITARDTIDSQMYAAGMRRVTPMEVHFGGQQFNGSVSADRNGNRFITDGHHTHRILPGDANNPHGYIQIGNKHEAAPVPITGQRVLNALGEDAFRPPHNAALKPIEAPVREHAGSNRPHELEPHIAAQLANPQTRHAIAELLSGLHEGKTHLDANSPHGRALNEFSRVLGPEGVANMHRALTETQGNVVPRFDNRFDQTAQSGLRQLLELLEPHLRATERTVASPDLGTQLNRFLDVFRGAERAAVPGLDGSREAWKEFSRALHERENSIDSTQKGLNLRELVSKAFEDGRQSSISNSTAGAFREFGIRTTDEAIVRSLVDRIAQSAISERRVEMSLQNMDSSTLRPGTNASADLADRELNARIDAIRSESNRADATRSDAIRSDVSVPQRSYIDDSLTLDPDSQRAQFQLDGQQLQANQTAAGMEDGIKVRKPDIDEDHIDEAAALLIAANARKLDGVKETEKDKQIATKDQDKDKKDEDRRQKYMVREGDTLESIASRMHRDKRLAGLIFEINSAVIPSSMKDGKLVVELKPRLIIFLPNSNDIKDYRARLASGYVSDSEAQQSTKFASAEEELEARFGKNWDSSSVLAPPQQDTTGGISSGNGETIEDLETAARAAYQARRQNIENLLGPLSSAGAPPETPKYIVRLGDTLKSIAMKHPALNDLTLWRLLAEINGLSTRSDDQSTILKRGQSLRLPTKAEIQKFKAGSAPQLTGHATGKPGTSQVPPAPGTVNTGEAPQRLHSGSFAIPEPLTAAETEVYKLRQELNERTRLLQTGTPDAIESGFKMRLEYKEMDTWRPIVVYEIFDDASVRHELQANGFRKTIKIDLPPQAAAELAVNDLTANWLSYLEKYTDKL